MFFLGSILIAFTTRTWVTSISIALMINLCYSEQIACRFSWIYHVFGWIVPICISMIIYVYSLVNPLKEISITGVEKFGKMQIILSIFVLVLCILINTINLLRIARRTYQVRHDSTENHHRNSEAIEGRPLIEDEEETNMTEIAEVHPVEPDSQLFRHAILVALLTLDAIVVSNFLIYKRSFKFYEIVCVGFIMVIIST
jgi:hypothetical protein